MKIKEVVHYKAICMVAVIMVHITATGVTRYNPEAFGFLVISVFNRLAHFAVPSFFMISAFLHFYLYAKRPFATVNWTQYFQKKMLYIIVPYLLFSAAYFSYRLADGFYHGKTLPAAMLDFLDRLIYGHNFYHLYFIIIILQFYVLFPLLLAVMQRWTWMMRHAIWLGLGLHALYLLLAEYSFSAGYFRFILFLGYYFLGIWLATHYERIKHHLFHPFQGRGKWVTVALIAVTVVSWFFYTHSFVCSYRACEIVTNLFMLDIFFLYVFPMSVIIYYLSTWLTKQDGTRISRISYEIGLKSFGIYLIHPFAQAVYKFIPSNAEQPIWFTGWMIGYFVFTLAASYVAVEWICRKVPGYRYLIGNVS